MNIRRDVLEQRVLTTLHTHLMDPALFSELCDEFPREFNSMKDGGARHSRLERKPQKNGTKKPPRADLRRFGVCGFGCGDLH